MAKDHRKNGRQLSRREAIKRAARRFLRKQAWRITGDGAGPRDINNPRQHRRRTS